MNKILEPIHFNFQKLGTSQGDSKKKSNDEVHMDTQTPLSLQDNLCSLYLQYIDARENINVHLESINDLEIN